MDIEKARIEVILADSPNVEENQTELHAHLDDTKIPDVVINNENDIWGDFAASEGLENQTMQIAEPDKEESLEIISVPGNIS